MKGTYKIMLIVLTVVVIMVAVFNKKASETKMLNPLPSGRKTSKFGDDRGTYKHNGLDLAAPTGTPIIAPLDGIVSAIYTNSAGGNQLLILHTNGITTGYAHLSKTLVKMGDYVKQGQPIAQVGNTGKSTGPHLHFTVTILGVKQDPEKFITT